MKKSLKPTKKPRVHVVNVLRDDHDKRLDALEAAVKEIQRRIGEEIKTDRP